MKPKYTAKAYLEDNQIIEKSGNNIEELITWIQDQAETSFGEVNGEIIDNMTHRIVKSIQYSSPDI